MRVTDDAGCQARKQCFRQVSITRFSFVLAICVGSSAVSVPYYLMHFLQIDLLQSTAALGFPVAFAKVRTTMVNAISLSCLPRKRAASSS